MNINFKHTTYAATIWKPEMGTIAQTLSYDTETTLIEDPATIPDYVIASACDGQCVFFIPKHYLNAFWTAHQASTVYMHSAAFDLAVTEKACGFDFNTMIEQGLILDIAILFRLLDCAKTGDIPQKYNLGIMSLNLLGYELNKEDAARTDFERFYNDGQIDYARLPITHLEYAAKDAIATYLLGELLISRCSHIRDEHNLNDAYGLLGHDIQLKGDIALRQIERNGLQVDQSHVKALDAKLKQDQDRYTQILAEYKYIAGQKGNRSVYDGVIRAIEVDRAITLPNTDKGRNKSQKAEDLIPVDDHPFVEAFIKIKEVDKLRKTYLEKLNQPVVHPHYNLMVKTGRTSCSNPNIQNLPREGGIRECIIARPGYAIVACDYSMLELCTLAQIVYSKYGHSSMRDLINNGTDLHRYVAAMVMNKPQEQISKSERQKAKAVNFGLPGGMGSKALQEYAHDSYHVDLSPEEAASWKAVWMDLFPEMSDYLEGGDKLERLGDTLDMNDYPYNGFDPDPKIAAALMIRVAGGHLESSNHRIYSQEEIDWAWKQIETTRAMAFKSYDKMIQNRRGNSQLQPSIQPGYPASIPTGRMRNDCTYTASRNWPFQALAADGAKLALYDLTQAGFRVVAFIHDEVLIEVPECDDYRDVCGTISEIMIKAMREICLDVEIRTESVVMKRWSKDAEAVYDDEGKLRVWEDELRLAG